MKYFLILALAASSLLAQNGDRPGEAQVPPPATMKIPPAPPLSADQAMKTFRLQPGFAVELVASEPMIEAPVEIEFDPDGRLFVLEMRGFMRNVSGAGEDAPHGRVSRLEDKDGDGRMDRSMVFADGLIMPRAIAVVRGGLLVAEPPKLWLFKDADGDGQAEAKEEVASDYGNQTNPEHNANGLLWGRDNWIYSANHTNRYRRNGNGWERETTIFRGQWGLSQDDQGRLFYNSNSDQLRGDWLPAEYLLRNPNLKTAIGGNAQIAKDQSTFPIRVNPGVNRGYQTGTLREDGMLAKFTGACGTLIYRGGLFPQAYYGAAFLCEPTGNFVRCNFLSEQGGVVAATNAFADQEFLASTDERFRPVNLQNGPDGALYIVDMARGVIQHRIYLTTYLRNQALERGLETPLNQGRIYRVVPEGMKRKPARQLGGMAALDLVKELNSPNGWSRDTAQQMLVERRDRTVAEPLRAVASKGNWPEALHALWTLHGLGEADRPIAMAALSAGDARIRAAAVRVAEGYLRLEGKNEVAGRIMAMAGDPSEAVRLQVALSLGESSAAEAAALQADLLSRHAEKLLFRSAVLSGWSMREIEMLGMIVQREDWKAASAGRQAALKELAQCIAESRSAARVGELLEAIAGDALEWRQAALLDGLAALIPAAGKTKTPAPVKAIALSAEPAALVKLASAGSTEVAERAKRLEPLFTWPGKAGVVENEVKPLTEAEKALFDAGREMYVVVCGACHQPNGLGIEGLAPPLVDSEWVLGSPDRLARITLHGVRGPISVKGKTWQLADMPRLDVLGDQELAGLLTYIRREWGHTAAAISPEFMGKVRAETAAREEAWTEAELLKVK